MTGSTPAQSEYILKGRCKTSLEILIYYIRLVFRLQGGKRGNIKNEKSKQKTK